MSSSTGPDQLFDYRQRIVGRRADDDPVIRLEIYGLLILAFAVSLLLALVTFNPVDVTAIGGTRYQPAHNLIGPIGAHVADLFLSFLGLGAFVVTPLLGFLGFSYLVGRRWQLAGRDVYGGLGVLVAATVLMHVGFAPLRFLGHLPGGMTGEYIGEISCALISTTGTLILALTGFMISLVSLTRRSVFELGVLAYEFARDSRASFQRRTSRVAAAVGVGVVEALHEVDAADIISERDVEGPSGLQRAPSTPPPLPFEALPADLIPTIEEVASSGENSDASEPPPEADAIPIRAPRDKPKTMSWAERKMVERTQHSLDAEPLVVPEAPSALGPVEPESVPAVNSDAPDAPIPVAEPVAAKSPATPVAATPAADGAPESLRIVESPAMRRGVGVVGEQMVLVNPEKTAEFELPSLGFLDYKAPVGQTYDREMLRQNAALLETALADFRVKGKVVEIHPGPVITMYEFKPATGVKISQIANLADDLKMALSALAIRIVAPIPGKDVVGIEVPNKTRETVWLKEIFSDNSYGKAKSHLTLALGKDIVGNPTCMNLAKAPHLLVAGATGAGKSVAINAFICSLLYRATPQQVRLIMIDPKILELSIYEGIPHLMLPVVTDPQNASIALRWAVKEMDRRYQLMADLGVRNLENFNAKVENIYAAEAPLDEVPEKLRQARLQRERNGNPDPAGAVIDCAGRALNTLPTIVIIVDELADLMMVAKKDVELSIARLAQKARACGIHLILATQRPSVDVITGLIKANFPTRISFRVSSKIDSRTILDQSGAESLLGMGDMLWLAPGGGGPKRVHGAFIDEDEVHRIVEHLKKQGKPDYDLDILVDDEADDALDLPSGGEDCDPLYDESLRIVAETRNASISFLQRKLKIGYNRAARIVEQLEEQGIIGPSDGTSRPREIFIDPI
jgi:DNA segregation ATPase FtsK/SpoIIIE, S-DNA-T family